MAGVKTRSQNRSARPAAPVITEGAKVKAGIQPAKPCRKGKTKDAEIRGLKVRIAELEHPDDPHPSREPLVCVTLFLLWKHALINFLQFLSDGKSDSSDHEVETDHCSDDDTSPGGKHKCSAQCWNLDEYSKQRVLNQERKIEEARSKSDSFCTCQRTVRTNYQNRQLPKRVIEYENRIF